MKQNLCECVIYFRKHLINKILCKSEARGNIDLQQPKKLVFEPQNENKFLNILEEESDVRH